MSPLKKSADIVLHPSIQGDDDQLMSLYRGLSCTADGTAQPSHGIGHNGCPEEPLFGVEAPWLAFANDEELRRLAQLHLRIERKKQNLHDLTLERQKIMNRSIRRMRRFAGKN